MIGLLASRLILNFGLPRSIPFIFWPLAIAQLVLVFALSALAPRVSGPVAALMFLGYSFLTGLTFSGLFWLYKLGSVASAFFVTAVPFVAKLKLHARLSMVRAAHHCVRLQLTESTNLPTSL